MGAMGPPERADMHAGDRRKDCMCTEKQVLQRRPSDENLRRQILPRWCGLRYCSCAGLVSNFRPVRFAGAVKNSCKAVLGNV